MPLLLAIVLIAIAGWQAFRDPVRPGDPAPREPVPKATPAARTDDSLGRAIAARASDVDVTGSGVVVKLLRDDREGSRHQRFLVDVGAERTILVAHNIDLAARVAPLAVGDRVEFAGEFEWNERGGVVHWTHPDPRGRHRAGYVRVVP
ncbi:MAG TPA: DUF3465 domain-containing protein [Xanthomonadales bacterium]|nr:DUF3465 domain-containing protein [Xanthomonadales bacterium]